MSNTREEHTQWTASTLVKVATKECNNNLVIWQILSNLFDQKPFWHMAQGAMEKLKMNGDSLVFTDNVKMLQSRFWHMLNAENNINLWTEVSSNRRPTHNNERPKSAGKCHVICVDRTWLTSSHAHLNGLLALNGRKAPSKVIRSYQRS